MITLTYGVLPDFDAFEQRFNTVCPDGVFKIRNCKELDDIYPNGNADLDLNMTWEIVVSGANNWTDNSGAGTIAADILETLGFEWI